MKTLDQHTEVVRLALGKLVAEGQQARRDVAQRITRVDDAEALAYAVAWARGVEEDVKGAYAARMLKALDGGRPLLAVLDWVIADCTDALRSSRFSPKSTSPFSNGVDLVRADVARKMLDACAWWRLELVTIRAEGELL